MQYKKQEIMDKIFKYAEEYYLTNHLSPSTSQIAKGIGVCRATVYNYLVAMNERRILSYNGKPISTDNITKVNSHGTRANIILHPENKQLKDIVVKELVIQGVAQQVIKDL